MKLGLWDIKMIEQKQQFCGLLFGPWNITKKQEMRSTVKSYLVEIRMNNTVKDPPVRWLLELVELGRTEWRDAEDEAEHAFYQCVVHGQIGPSVPPKSILDFSASFIYILDICMTIIIKFYYLKNKLQKNVFNKNLLDIQKYVPHVCSSEICIHGKYLFY